MFEAVALNTDHVNEQLSSALSAASERIYVATQYVLSQLHRMVLEVFASAAEFLNVQLVRSKRRGNPRVCKGWN